MPSEHLLAFTTCPDADSARAIARVLVEEKLAACINVLPGIASIYRWQGETLDEPECLLLMKTSQSVFERLAARLKTLHPYELPELIAIPIAEGSRPYLQWLTDATDGFGNIPKQFGDMPD
ncbi:divalent-cation tolerance protein CutA [soil metagenome]